MDLVGESEGKRKLRRPRRQWEDNSRGDLQEIGWGGVGNLKLSQYRDRWRTFVKAVMNICFP